MCSEVLSGLCNRAQQKGLIQGLRAARGSPRISHLFFADDTMFFLQANKENCSALNSIVSQYENASGQSINKDKSAISFSRKTPTSLKRLVKTELQISKEGGVGKYLGLPEHFGRRKRDLFALVVDRIKQKARTWSTKHLSAAGKLVMVQSVLSAVPSYPMSSFLLPVALCKKLQSAVTRFWWDSNESTKKMAWVSWDTMAKPKAIGGLGFRDFQNFNIALPAKTSWRLVQNPDSLLSRVLSGKYCLENNLLTVGETTSISHGWRSVLGGRDLLVKKLGWVVGDGLSINIWDDAWLSLTEQKRPMGPAGEATVELRVADLLLTETMDWDRELIQQILPGFERDILRLKPSITGTPDRLVWLGTKSGDYTTKSGYFAAVENEGNLVGGQAAGTVNWKKDVWTLPCAPKVKLFAWKLFKGALPVGERLVERHIAADPKCKRCGRSESILHLLFHCCFAQQVWLLAPFVTELDVRGILDLEASWSTLCNVQCLPPAGITSGSLALWILWLLWKARNKFFYEGHSTSPAETLSLAIRLAREWSLNCSSAGKTEVRIKGLQAPTTSLSTVVLRTDAAWDCQQEAAGLGWAIFTPDGIQRFKKGVSFVSSPLLAEGMAMREAMALCSGRSLQTIRVESDSAQLIKALTSGYSVSELHGVLADILAFVAKFDFVSFAWIPRERNSEADRLAKLALNDVSSRVVEMRVVEMTFNALN